MQRIQTELLLFRGFFLTHTDTHTHMSAVLLHHHQPPCHSRVSVPTRLPPSHVCVEHKPAAVWIKDQRRGLTLRPLCCSRCSAVQYSRALTTHCQPVDAVLHTVSHRAAGLSHLFPLSFLLVIKVSEKEENKSIFGPRDGLFFCVLSLLSLPCSYLLHFSLRVVLNHCRVTKMCFFFYFSSLIRPPISLDKIKF